MIRSDKLIFFPHHKIILNAPCMSEEEQTYAVALVQEM